ncbi:MAG: type 1 glutamine amidotransferase [Rhodovibrionaceae bacterium]
MTRILVLQHHPSEHPGVFREFLAADGIAWDSVELDAGEEIPPLDGYDALWVFGGPMDTWQEEAHPWLVTEKAAIRAAVEDHDLPYLGVCLGHQLLAAALGGKVAPSATPEVGVCGLEVLADDPLIGKAGNRPMALQWHSAEIAEPCPGMEILASSPLCKAQAIKVGPRAYGIQYHMEVTAETVPTWAAIPEYKAALEKTIGAAALPAFEAEVTENLAAFRRDAKRLYEGFRALLG